MRIPQRKFNIIYIHRFYRISPYTNVILVQYKLHTFYGIKKYYVIECTFSVISYLITKDRYTDLQFWPGRKYD